MSGRVPLVLLVLAACSSPAVEVAGPEDSSTEEARASGTRVSIEGAEVFVPEGVDLTRETLPLTLHFQGGPAAAQRDYASVGEAGVHVASTLAGFSSAFSKPYRDPAALDALLGEAARAVQGLGGLAEPPAFDPVTITFFSAGYGAVREFLRHPAHFERIDRLVAADSIYADVAAPGVRAPRAEQMEGFARFAQAAARGEKTFALAVSGIETPYASTGECARFLLAAVAAEPVAQAGARTAGGIPIDSEAHVGGFHAYFFASKEAQIHLDCFHMIPELLRAHPAPGAGTVE